MWLVDAEQPASESAPTTASSQYRGSAEGSMFIFEMQCHFKAPSLTGQIKL